MLAAVCDVVSSTLTSLFRTWKATLKFNAQDRCRNGSHQTSRWRLTSNALASPCVNKVSLEKSAEASLELDRQREVYREFARAGSTLFFLVETMKVLNQKYCNTVLANRAS